MLSLGREITSAIRNGLKQCAIRLVEKEEDLVRLEKQLDKTVEEGKVTRKEADDSLKELRELANADLMAKPNEIGKLGGKVLNASQIIKLRGELKQRGVLLILEEDLKIKSITNQYEKIKLNGMEFENAQDLFFFMKRKGFAGAFDARTKQFILSEKSTELVAFHEKAHLQHFEELGEEYHLLKPWGKETYVFEKIWSQKHLWTEEELTISLNYVNRERINAGVRPLTVKL